MTKRSLPTPEQLRELLRYDPDTGKLYWRKRERSSFPCERIYNAWKTCREGKEALTSANELGYKRGNIMGMTLRAHRVAWAIFYGEWPKLFIDHINSDASDNRIINLREASAQQNNFNQRPYKNATSNLKGVYLDKQTGRWRSKIRLNGKHIHLGRFDTEAEAHAAYCAAAKKYHGDFARTE